MRCEDKKVISLEYILDDKVVDKDTYITTMYKREKDYVDKYMLEKNMVSTKTSNSQELSITSKKDVPLIREIVEQKNASIPALDVQKSNNKNTFASMTLVKT
jgi:hypothetical protein